jgi:hypothetical protein
MNAFELFKNGAMALASPDGTFAYTDTHASYGVSKANWDKLRSKEPWTAPVRSQMKAALPEVLNIAYTVSGLPASRIPAEYIAAVVASVVSPANVLIAANIVPLGYDAAMASGLNGPSKIEDVTRERMIALCLAYAGGWRTGGAFSPAVETSEPVEA